MQSEKLFVIPVTAGLPGVAIAAVYPNEDVRSWWAPGFTTEQQRSLLESLILRLSGVVMTSESPWVEVEGVSLPAPLPDEQITKREDFTLFD